MTAQIFHIAPEPVLLKRAHELQAEQGKAIAKIDWNARAALKQSEKGNHSAARRFIRHILATTTGAQS